MQAAPGRARESGARPPGTQHLLLVLGEQEEGGAARVLGELGVSPVDVERSVLGMAATETRQPEPETGGVRLSSELEHALLAANAFSHKREDHYLGTPHILWAIAASEECLGHAILLELGVDLERLEAEVNLSLIAYPEKERDWAGVRQALETGPSLTPAEERECARRGRAGRTALTAMKADHGGVPLRELETREPDLWKIYEEGRAGRSRLVDAHYRLLVELGETYERDGHDPFWVISQAVWALHDAAKTWDPDADPDERFRDHAWPLLTERVEEDLRRRESL